MIHTEEVAGNSSSYPVNTPLSLFQLSEDLGVMFDKEILCDVTLRVGDRDIQCHRAILSARSTWFSSKIPQVSTIKNYTIVVNESDQIMEALLLYMYTGNLRLIESLKIPLKDLLESANKYGLHRFKKLLTRMIKLKSLSKTLEFLWKIYVRRTVEYSYPLLECSSQQDAYKWHLKIRPPHNCEFGHTTRVYLERQTKSSTNKIHVVRSEIHILDTVKQKRRTFIKECYFKKDGEEYVAKYTFPCSENEKIPLSNRMLTISGKLTVSEVDSTLNSTIFQVTGLYEKGITNELHALSYDMFKMMKAGMFCDMSIHIEGSQLFMVHACLLFARSLIPISAFSTLVDCGIFEDRVLGSFISFIYTGQARFLEHYMRVVYSAVWKLQLTEAKIKYSNILANNLSIDNVLGILTDAAVFDDEELILAALSFVERHTNDLVGHGTWSQLSLAHPNWAGEIKQMAKSKRVSSLIQYLKI